MSDATAIEGLSGLMSDLGDLSASRESITLKDLLDTIGARGHGPIILVLAALMLLPTGMLPLMPQVMGGLLVLTAFEMLVGGKGVSLPPWITKREMGTKLLAAAVARARPVSDHVGLFLRPRYPWLIHSNLSLCAIAVLLIIASAVMIVIGGIPGLPFVLCIPAVLFGLGLTTGDGGVVALGYVATLAVVIILTAFLPAVIRLFT